jgi:hypothetical protein
MLLQRSQNIILILFNFITLSFQNQQKPTNLIFRLNKRGVDFFSLFGHKLVNKELPKIIFPNISLPINSGIGSGFLINLILKFILKKIKVK